MIILTRRRTFIEYFFEAIVEIITYPIRQIRNIAEKPAGYLKLSQFIIIFFALGGFSVLLLYIMFWDKEFIDPDIFITVIVGLIGTIVGMFFSESAMKQIEEQKKELEQDVKAKEFNIKSAVRLLNEVDKKQYKFEKIINEYLKKYHHKKR